MVKDGRLGIRVDRNNFFCAVHSRKMLNRTGDADRQIDLRADRVAGLADLTGVWSKAGIYRRSGRADGTAQLDANTGAQAQFDNLLVLYSASRLRDDGTTLDYDLSLGGGVWLNGSQLWHITWTQGTDSTFAFYDADGRPLTIRTGRRYIALVSSVTGQELTVLDSAGQNVLN